MNRKHLLSILALVVLGGFGYAAGKRLNVGGRGELSDADGVTGIDCAATVDTCKFLVRDNEVASFDVTGLSGTLVGDYDLDSGTLYLDETDDSDLTLARTGANAAQFTGTLAITGVTTGLAGWETKTTDYSVTCPDDSGKIFSVATDAVYLVLPAVAAANAGCCVTLVNTGAATTVQTGFSVNASDAVFGSIANSAADSSASGSDDQAWGNTAATHAKGDRTTLCSDGSTGWFIVSGKGVWASTAQ